MSIIPKNWMLTEIGAVAEIVTGNTPPRTNVSNYGGDIPWVKPPDINKATYVIETEEFLSEAGCASARIIPAGSVMVTCIGNLGNVAIAGKELATNQQINSIVVSSSDLLPKYVYYQALTWKKWLLENSTSTTISLVNKSRFAKAPILLPPLPEQKCIVAKLDTLFAHLDQLKARLEKIPGLLKQFRQAVLTQAVTGKLTEEWRNENANVLSGNKLTDKLLTDRENKYLINLKEAVSRGSKKPSKPNLVDREVNSHDLPAIPDSWRWIFGETLFERIFDGTHFSPKNFSTGKYKYITAKNIKEWGIDLSNITYVSEKDHNEIYSRADVKLNDVLYIKDGATTGIATINTLDEEFSLLSSVGVFRCNSEYILPHFVKYYLNGNKERFLSNIAGIAITRLTLDKLNNAVFCLPPVEEQKEIVRRVESLLAIADRIEASYKILQEKIDQLPQAILSKAFRGELIEQDVANEINGYKTQLDNLSLAAEP